MDRLTGRASRPAHFNPLSEIWSRRAGSYQSEYLVPSRAVPSEPLLTSYTPGEAVGVLGSGSEGTVCHDSVLFVKGSTGSYPRRKSRHLRSTVNFLGKSLIV